MEKRFAVSVVLDVKENKTDGSQVDFFNATVNYPDMGYDGVVGIEQALLQVLSTLGDAGLQKAMELGLSDKLHALGLSEKIAAFQR